MRFKYLLWDFDGTLFDTYPPLVQAIEHALAEYTIDEAPDEIAERLADTLSGCIAALVAKHALDAAAFEARVDHYWGQTTPADNPPFPGVKCICEHVVSAGGSNYIVTHRGRESLLSLLDWHQMTGLFADFLTRDDGYPRKPDPASFNAVIEKHHLNCDEMLVVGDRKLDILAGQAAGVRTCLFKALPTPPTLDFTPDYVIARIDELDAVLG